MAAVLENVSTAPVFPPIAPRDRSREEKYGVDGGRKSVGNRHFLREPSSCTRREGGVEGA